MDNVLQNTQPSASILSTQVQKTSNHKRPINYLKILFIITLFVSISSTAVLAYLNYNKNKIIIERNLQDYFYGNSDSETLKKMLQFGDFNASTNSASLAEEISQELVQIRIEAVKSARDKALADINAATTAAALSYGIVETNDLDNLISFIVPKDFSKISVINEDNNPSISMKSADFKYSADTNFASGVYISIFKKNVDSTYQISDEDNETNRKYLTDFKITTIGGKPAAYGFLEFESFTERYFILNNSERWSIYIGYGGNTLQEALSYKAKYKNEIDKFINSISFK